MLVTSRTPLRVSFFGGGTDYPEYFHRYPGAVIGMAINKYIYISAVRLADFIDYRYRVAYSRLERAHAATDIEHPVIRAVLTHYKVQDHLDINVMAEMPASSGLGSSSAFTVGFLNLINELRGRSTTRLDLGLSAIEIEREVLQERVGVQDQLHAAFGGMNRFDFQDGRIRITPIQMRSDCEEELMRSLVLVYTGLQRHASETVKEQLKATTERRIDGELNHLMALTNHAVGVLEGASPDRMIIEFGQMMHEGWETKRKLSSSVSKPEIDALYEAARDAGAIGGKLCGAGGGGFLLMVVPPTRRARFEEQMRTAKLIPVKMDVHGSTILRG